MLAGQNGARGRIRTCTGDALEVVSLRSDYASEIDGASCRCCPGTACLQRKPAGCRKKAKWSQSSVLPWAQRAYETCLSAGSTAFELWKWSPHPELHRAKTRVSGECIAANALGALSSEERRTWSAEWKTSAQFGILHSHFCLLHSHLLGLLFPAAHAPENSVPDRLRFGDLLHERQACWLDYTTGTKGW